MWDCQLNQWFYSRGGMYAHATTRGAIRGLRDACLDWEEGKDLRSIWQWRDDAVLLLRHDIGLTGTESYEFDNVQTVLERVRRKVEETKK